jgi:cation diffusion facilitator family transporter
MTDPARGIRAAQTGLLANTLLVLVKLLAGILGNTYALIADAVESGADIFSSLIVWRGLTIATQPPDEDHPYGHGKAEALAATVVAFMLLAAAIGIAIQALREIRTPHHTPAPWTLLVLVLVMVVKWMLARRVHAIGLDIGSTAVKADAFHHLSDAFTSAAAFIGISIAVLGSRWRGGPGWESADDWAALFASGIIAYNGISIARPAVHDLMDRTPGEEIVGPLRRAASTVPGVLAIEKLAVRKSGLAFHASIHVQADPRMSLDAAHQLGGRVKAAMRRELPRLGDVLVHMEPYSGDSSRVDSGGSAEPAE